MQNNNIWIQLIKFAIGKLIDRLSATQAMIALILVCAILIVIILWRSRR